MPSIERVLCDLARRGIQRATLLPLYPQFADSTVTTVLEEARQTLQRHRLRLQLDVVAPFHDRPEYLSALGASMRPYLAQPHDHLLLSYHGLPERHIRKADPTGRHCLCGPSCCLQSPANVLERCYRAQCVRTSERLTAALGIPHERWSLAFQSRLGRDRWLEPATDATITRLAKEGVKRLAVLSPAFVADCLETLEEIGIGGKENFLGSGGEAFVLAPSLNTHPTWVEAMARLIEQAL